MGYLNAQIEPRVVFLKDTNSVDVIFNITEGYASKITEIVFNGNNNFSARKLKEQILSKELGILQINYSNASFEEGKTSADAQMLISFYQNNGYAKVNVKSITTTFDKRKYGFRIAIDIDEGEKEVERGETFTHREVMQMIWDKIACYAG